MSQFLSFNNEETLLIFSDPRGGSTWLTELISMIPKTAVVWEPLHPDVDSRFRELNFDSRQYIPEHDDWPEVEKLFMDLFRGKLLNSNSFVLSSPIDFLFAEYLVIKFCRGNAMLPWITRRFSFRFSPIYLVRHPFAVVASQLRHGAWNFKINIFQIPDTPYNEFYTDHRDFLKTLNTREECLTAVWCLTNLVPLNNFRNNVDWVSVYYEDLIRQPEKELERIFNIWNKKIPDNIFENIRKKSLTTKRGQFENDIYKQLRKWKGYFSKKQIDSMQTVLDYFDVHCYSSKDFLPKK